MLIAHPWCQTHTVEVSMSGRFCLVVVAILLGALLLPEKLAASQQPSLIPQGTYVSPAVRDMPPQAHSPEPPGKIAKRHLPARRSAGDIVDPVVQTSTTTNASAQEQGQWEGLGAGYPGFSMTAVPPDPNMAVGPNHIVQWVNNAFVVFDKSGAPLILPVSDGDFWGALSDSATPSCSTTAHPIVGSWAKWLFR
jgi:hypothetical protein